MKTYWQYLRFFLYITKNWNIGLAFFMLFHDIRGAFRYGVKTFVPEKLKSLTIINGDISKASPYEPVNYYILENLLHAFRKLSDNRSIIDLGSGKGRVMVVAAYTGFLEITGIDFAKELCEEATRNMKKIAVSFPALTWKVINENVLNYQITSHDSVFFMFNPFHEEILKKFLEKVHLSVLVSPRTVWFLYASPILKDVLINYGYEQVWRKKFMNLEGIILRKAN